MEEIKREVTDNKTEMLLIEKVENFVFDAKVFDDKKKKVSVSPEYYQFKENTVLQCFFVGFNQIEITDENSGELKKMKTAVLHTINGIALNSGVNLVNQLQNLVDMNIIRQFSPLEISLKEKKNKVNIFNIVVVLT